MSEVFDVLLVVLVELLIGPVVGRQEQHGHRAHSVLHVAQVLVFAWVLPGQPCTPRRKDVDGRSSFVAIALTVATEYVAATVIPPCPGTTSGASSQWQRRYPYT